MLFWPEISALGVFFYFDNERMRPPEYPSAPAGDMIACHSTPLRKKLKRNTLYSPKLHYKQYLVRFLFRHKGWHSFKIDVTEVTTKVVVVVVVVFIRC